ncbi:MAG: hypothetical protein ABJC63_14805, partial [Gemmatimonadales bacterium]
CTMPGFPDKFSPFYKEPPGGIISTTMSKGVGAVIRRARRLSNRHANSEVRWDKLDEVPSGWANVDNPTPALKVVEIFYKKWQFWGAKAPGRPRGTEERFWGGDRPGTRSDYLDDSSAKEDTDVKH